MIIELLKIVETCAVTAVVGAAIGELLRRAGRHNARGKR